MSNQQTYGRVASSYLEQEIGNAQPLELIARLYDMARLEVARAQAAVQSGDRTAKARAVTQAGRCLSMLQCSLNREKGGEVAHNLDRIYTYLLSRLSQGHVSNEPTVFEEIARHLAELGEAWTQVSRQPTSTPAAEAGRQAASAGTAVQVSR